ncbi:hypothetical protein GCM10010341_90180 [Streptomyces noursei]|nr:hypothetical protein GCM10010341_90180 [Streptomyces noursei]
MPLPARIPAPGPPAAWNWLNAARVAAWSPAGWADADDDSINTAAATVPNTAVSLLARNIPVTAPPW